MSNYKLEIMKKKQKWKYRIQNAQKIVNVQEVGCRMMMARRKMRRMTGKRERQGCRRRVTLTLH